MEIKQRFPSTRYMLDKKMKLLPKYNKRINHFDTIGENGK